MAALMQSHRVVQQRAGERGTRSGLWQLTGVGGEMC